MRISQYDLYKRLLPWLFLYLIITMFFFMRKVSIKYNLEYNINLFSALVALFSTLFIGLGSVYVFNKLGKFEQYKNIIITSNAELAFNCLIILLPMIIITILFYFFA